MITFWKKEKIITQKVCNYLDQVKKCLDTFKQCILLYLEEGNSEKFSELVRETHLNESRADDLRRDIEMDLYSKALLPEVREDIMTLLDLIDKIPNKAEATVIKTELQEVSIPDELKKDIVPLIYKSLESFEALMEATCNMFEAGKEDTRFLAKRVDDKESEVDKIEHGLFRKIFKLDIELALKILLRDTISDIADIADRAENAADRLVIIAAKRQA